MSAPRSPVRAAILAGEGSDLIRPEVEAAGFAVVPEGTPADFAISYGGDGTLLGTDQRHPDIPKLPIRRSGQFSKCPRHRNAAVLERVRDGSMEVVRLPRLHATAGGRELAAINDIVFHNIRPQSGVRYRVRIDGRPYSGEIVGDGLVVATPFGSSAYYRAITQSVIRVGIGLAFNNSTEAIHHLVLDPSSIIEVEVTRGPACLVGDNIETPIELGTGDSFTIGMGRDEAVVWELGTLLCHDCKDRETGRGAGFRHV